MNDQATPKKGPPESAEEAFKRAHRLMVGALEELARSKETDPSVIVLALAMLQESVQATLYGNLGITREAFEEILIDAVVVARSMRGFGLQVHNPDTGELLRFDTEEEANRFVQSYRRHVIHRKEQAT